VVHAVNYGVPIVPATRGARGSENSGATKAGRPAAVHRLQISVPLPPARTVAAIEALSPTEQAGIAGWSQTGDRVTLTLERLKIYAAGVIALE